MTSVLTPARPFHRNSAAFFIVCALVYPLVLTLGMTKNFSHDEHQHVAAGTLIAREGLLPYRDFPHFHTPYLAYIYALLFRGTDHLLLAARLFTVVCATAIVGLVGAVVVALWARRLISDTSKVLLDREMDHPLTQDIRAALESDGDAKVADLHVWRVGRSQFAAIACVVADLPLAPAAYRARLAKHDELVHVSLEVNRCPQAGDGHAA